MNLKSLLILVVLSLGIGTYVYFEIQRPLEQKEANAEKEGQIVSEDLAGTKEIEISSTEIPKLSLHLEKNAWKMTEPVKDLAAFSKVEGLLSNLEKLKKTKDILSADEIKKDKAALAAFGLDTPRMTLKYKVSQNPDFKTLILGKSNPTNTGSYLQIGNSDAPVLLVSQELDSTATQKADDFREMRLTTVVPSDYDEIEITRNDLKPPQKLKLKRAENGNDWQMAEPYQLPLAKEFVNGQVEKISFIRANQFLDKDSSIPKDPDIKIVVGFKEKISDARTSETDKRPHGVEILLWKKKATKPKAEDLFYAASDKSPVAEIARYHYENFFKTAEDYLSKDINDLAQADIQKLSFRPKKGDEVEFIKQNENYQVSQKGKEAKTLSAEKFKDLLKPIRELKADAADGVAKKAPEVSDLEAIFELSSGKSLTYYFDFPKKDKAKLILRREDGVLLSYLLKPQSIDSNAFQFDRIFEATKAGAEAPKNETAIPDGESKEEVSTRSKVKTP